MGLVYFLCDESTKLVKIGRTSDEDIESRLSSLQTGNPSRLWLVKQIQTADPSGLENYYHLNFASKHVRGEFYRLSDADLNKAELLAEKYDNAMPIKDKVELLKAERDDGLLIDQTDSYREIVERWIEIKRKYAELKLEKDQIELELKEIIGVHSGINGLVTWKSYERNELDRARLKIEEPEIYEEFSKIVIQRRLIPVR